MSKKNSLSGLSILAVGMALAFTPQNAAAQSFKYDFKMSADCSIIEFASPPKSKFLAKEANITPKPPKDKQRKKFGIKAAEAALNAGYNYIIIAPLRTRYAYDVKDVVIGGGISAAEKVERRYNHRTEIVQDCAAIDDVAALNLIWKDSLPSRLGSNEKGYEIVDIREFIRTLDGENAIVSRPRSPKISEIHYKKIGDRERIAAQLPVMAAAGKCRFNLKPQSLQVFKRNGQLRDRAAEKKCLETHRSSAETVNWVDFPLSVTATKNTLATKGYTLNRPRTSGTTNSRQGKAIQSDIWGEGWIDLSPNLNSPSGTFFFHPYKTTYLIASNTLDETAVIDHAVFLSAGRRLDDRNNSLALKDKTEEFRSKFESAKRSLLGKHQKTGQKLDRANNSKVRSQNRKVEYKQRDITELEQRIDEMRQQDDEATIAQMKTSMAAFPGAKFDETALRKQLQTVREANIQAKERKLAELRRELTSLQEQQSLQGQQSTPLPQSVSTPTEPKLRPSQESSFSDRSKGIYYAFETYQNVLVVEAGSVAGTRCQDYYLLCADKLQAYNAIGPRLGKSGFTPLTAPSGYKPWADQ